MGLEFKLEDIKEGKVRKREIYSNGYYEVNRTIHKECGLITYSVYLKEGRDYMPTIEVDDDIYTFTLKDFKIQTTAYGSKDVEDIQKIIKGYEIAIESVKELERMFELDGNE